MRHLVQHKSSACNDKKQHAAVEIHLFCRVAVGGGCHKSGEYTRHKDKGHDDQGIGTHDDQHEIGVDQGDAGRGLVVVQLAVRVAANDHEQKQGTDSTQADVKSAPGLFPDTTDLLRVSDLDGLHLPTRG